MEREGAGLAGKSQTRTLKTEECSTRRATAYGPSHFSMLRKFTVRNVRG